MDFLMTVTAVVIGNAITAYIVASALTASKAEKEKRHIPVNSVPESVYMGRSFLGWWRANYPKRVV